jgi:hypothetical protein
VGLKGSGFRVQMGCRKKEPGDLVDNSDWHAGFGIVRII